MSKTSKPFSGAAKNAYLKRAVAGETGIDAATRDRLTRRLQEEIATVGLRPAVAEEAMAAVGAASDPEPAEPMSAAPQSKSPSPSIAPAAAPPAEFDPYSPNVVVVIRTRGRDAVLAELASISDIASLRLLAREQQLGIPPELASAADVRLAIVAAAERRIANRRAAAS